MANYTEARLALFRADAEKQIRFHANRRLSMTQQHPITPPPKLVLQWAGEFYRSAIAPGEASINLAIRAAQWGADQELEACCELIRDNDGYDAARNLRADRRPKPDTSVVSEQLTSSEIAQLRQQKRTISASAQEMLSLRIRRAPEQLDG